MDEIILDLMLGSRESFRRSEMMEKLKAGELDERNVETELPDLR